MKEIKGKVAILVEKSIAREKLKREIQENISKLQKQYDEIIKEELKEETAKYELSDYYYRIKKYHFIDSMFKVDDTKDYDIKFDQVRFQNMNYFENQAEAEKYRDYYKLYTKVIKCRNFVNSGWTPDWTDGKKKHCVALEYCSKSKINILLTTETDKVNPFSFETIEQLTEFLDSVSDKDLKSFLSF